MSFFPSDIRKLITCTLHPPTEHNIPSCTCPGGPEFICCLWNMWLVYPVALISSLCVILVLCWTGAVTETALNPKSTSLLCGLYVICICIVKNSLTHPMCFLTTTEPVTFHAHTVNFTTSVHHFFYDLLLIYSYTLLKFYCHVTCFLIMTWLHFIQVL